MQQGSNTCLNVHVDGDNLMAVPLHWTQSMFTARRQLHELRFSIKRNRQCKKHDACISLSDLPESVVIRGRKLSLQNVVSLMMNINFKTLDNRTVFHSEKGHLGQSQGLFMICAAYMKGCSPHSSEDASARNFGISLVAQLVKGPKVIKVVFPVSTSLLFIFNCTTFYVSVELSLRYTSTAAWCNTIGLAISPFIEKWFKSC